MHCGLSSPNGPATEPETGCIDTPHEPLLHDIGSLDRRAVLELHPIVEAWINHDGRGKRRRLVGNNAYGLRIYRNESRLNMHVDQSGTHIISAILHVDHDEDSEPWVSAGGVRGGLRKAREPPLSGLSQLSRARISHFPHFPANRK